MKSKVRMILFWALFLPYLRLVGNSFVSRINGVSVGFFGDDTLYYGTEGYSTTFVFGFFVLWYIFAAALIGQISILLFEKIKHHSKIKFYVIGMILIYLLGDVPMLI